MAYVPRAAVLLTLVAIASCSQGRSGAPGDPGVAAVPVRAAPTIAPEFDLNAVMARVHFAFRASGADTFVAEHPTHRATVKRGSIAFEPFSTTTAGPTLGRHGAALQLETIAAGRVALGAPSTSIGATGDLRVVRGPIEESLENRADGVEQSWTLTSAPQGNGDFVVSLRVQGEKYVGQTEHGLHFVDPKTGLGVRYGVAHFVDAKGTRSDVAMAYRDGRIVLTVPEAVLAKTAYPAVLDPTIGAEFGIDNPIVSIDAGVQSPALASDGTNFLLAWADPRAGIDPTSYQSKREIYAARIAASGALLDPTGFLIAGAPSGYQSKAAPAVAYGGGEYLVVWSDGRANSVSSAGNEDIYGARVTPAGAVLDATGIAISTASSTQSEPKVVFDGTRFFVVWTDGRNTSADIYGAQVSVAGVVAQPTGIAISNASMNQIAPAVGWTGTNYVVAWSDCRAYTSFCSTGDGYAARVTAAGVVSDPGGLALGGPAARPAIGCGGGECLVAFASTTLSGRKVGNSGLVGSGPTTLVSTYNPEYPSVAFDGTNFLLVWDDWRAPAVPYSPHAFASRVTPALAMLDGTGVALGPATTQQQAPVIAFDGSTNYFVAWMDYRHSAGNWFGSGSVSTIYGTRLSKTMTVLDSPNLALTKANNRQGSAAIGSDGTGYLVAWTDQRNAGSDIYAARVSATGTILDPSGIAVSTAVAVQKSPRISWDGTNYFVVWQDYRTPDMSLYYQDSAVYGARVSPAGTLLDGPAATGGIKIAGITTDSPSVAFNGTNHVVVMRETNTGILSVRVGKDGVVLDSTPNTIAGGFGGGKSDPAIASNGANTLAVWSDNRGGEFNAYAARIGADGKSLDGSGFVVSNSVNSHWDLTVAGNGTDYLVAWREYATSLPSDIYAARVRGGSATVVDTTPLTIAKAATYEKGAPRIAFARDSLNYVVAWSDRRSGNDNVYASWINTATGANLDPGGRLISGDTTEEVEPDVAASSGGKLLFAYHRDVGSPTHATRIRARLVTSGTLGGVACATGADCASRLCVDGVCCSTACNSPCQTCAATPGTCTTVTSADDPDTCPTSTSTCNSAGACKKKLGQGCGAAAECSSNFCVDGYCCNSACSGGCDRCGSSGTCAPVSSGTSGSNPACAPYLCTGGSGCPTTCATDAACESGYYCSAGGTCERRKNNGETCNLTTDCSVAGCRECTTGNCVDGVCCDTACAGGCDVCNATPGTCTVVAAGAPGAPACSPYVCVGLASCPTTCTADVQCASGSYCGPAGTCIAQKAKGAACDATSDCKTAGCRVCSTGQCVDSVCCDTACTGTCQACAAALKTSGADGECGNAADGRDPHDSCPSDPTSTCQRDGMCNGTGGCRLHTSGTACGSSVCDGSVAKGQLCDGLGVCKSTPAGTECNPFLCKTGGCTTTCATSADCASTAWCDLGLCKPRVANGIKCTAPDSCTSNLCVDGVCCNAPCGGACEACDVAGGEGTCVPVSGDPHGSRTKCAEGSMAEPCKAAKCDGIERTTCAGFAGSTVRCREASCTAGSAIASAQCDGKGNCPAGEPQTCGAYTCGAEACKTTCATTADCATNFACDPGTSKCVPSAVCDGDHTVTGAGGVTTNCAPFKCEASGQCKVSCASSDDCVSPNLCNAGVCQAPPTAEPEDSGGCATSSARAGSPSVLALLALASIALRRRRAAQI